MKKWIMLLAAAAMLCLFAACGKATDAASNQPQNIESSANQDADGTELNTDDEKQEVASTEQPSGNANQVTENIVTNEELLGSWVSKNGVLFTINADGSVKNESRDFCMTFTADSKYDPWKVEGNYFIFREAMGSVLKFEITKQDDQLKLKYLEMTEGGFVAGIMVEEFMTELTKQTAMPVVLETEALTGVWTWQADKSAGVCYVRSFELYADGTGKILSATAEDLTNATFRWRIENERLRWEAVSVGWFGGWDLEPRDQYLTDLTWSDCFQKEPA